MFKTINKLLKPHNQNTDSSVELCNKFHKYFMEKVQDIYSSMATGPSYLSEEPYLLYLSSTFINFVVVTTDDISKLVMSINSATCSLDPIPTEI